MYLNVFLRLLAVLALCSLFYLSPAAWSQGQNASNQVNVKDYGAAGDGSKDDTLAISNAINSPLPPGSAVLNVYFPPGTYRLSGAVALKSNVRLFGNGDSSVISQGAGLSIFHAAGTPTSPASNIVVENLSFKGVGGFQSSYGLSVTCGRNITFKNNSANTIPLFSIACGATSDDSLLSSSVLVTDNRGTGILGEGAAIMLQFVADAIVSNNILSNYDHGIQYWGGDSAKGDTYGGVKRITIAANKVQNVVGGAIWGSEGSRIFITGNIADNCGDVCLDAEASSEVTISGNTVQNAVNGGIATFFGSTGVIISSNTVIQEATYQKPASHPNSSYAAVHIHGGNRPSNHVTQNVQIFDNTLNVAGVSWAITTDQGALGDSTIRSNVIASSSPSSAPIRILGGSNVDILTNRISGAAPVGVSIEGPSRSSILNNVIAYTGASRVLDTSKGGIHIYWRSAAEPAQYNQIKGNTITGYPISINDDCWGDNSSFNVIDNNLVDTVFHRGSGAAYKGVIANNHSNSNASAPVGGIGY